MSNPEGAPPSGPMANTLGLHNPLRYRGYVYDTETGLYYLQSRYYDPNIGRFLNADAFTSTGQGLVGNNMFAYCLNNPINYADPSGFIVIEITVTTAGCIVVVSVCGVAIAYYSAKALASTITWIYEQWFCPFIDYITISEEVETQLYTYKPHTSNQRESNRNAHEEGNARRQRDQGGEKKKQNKKWKANPNKRKGGNNNVSKFNLLR